MLGVQKSNLIQFSVCVLNLSETTAIYTAVSVCFYLNILYILSDWWNDPYLLFALQRRTLSANTLLQLIQHLKNI